MRQHDPGRSGLTKLDGWLAALRSRVALATLSVSASALLAAGVWLYPLPAWPLALALLSYAAVLLRYPGAFLIVLPVVFPAVNLGMWTGWFTIGESDLFFLATIAIVPWRIPVVREDLVPPGWTGRVLLALIVALGISVGLGLAVPPTVPPSANALLRPDNALRLAKGYVEALALFPLLSARYRMKGDTAILFAWGMVTSLIAVGLEVMAERILFTKGLFDFQTNYRVVAAFSSMRVGGGHISAWFAMTLPFLIAARTERQRWLAGGITLLAALGGIYSLIVTYARTAYVAATVGLTAAGIGRLTAGKERRSGRLGAALLLLMIVCIGFGAGFTVMRARLGRSSGALATREANWRAGWAESDPGLVSTLFGMGLGSYQRIMLARSPVNRPSNLALEHDQAGAYLTIWTRTPFYLGQKISPPVGTARISLRFRADTPNARLGILLCDKMLVYSERCRGTYVRASITGTWEKVSVSIPSKGLSRYAMGGLLHRPVELSLFGSKGSTISLQDVRLIDGAGRSLVANGGFSDGLDRWIFTDDSHVSWRILNVYLMQLFETGIIGLGAVLAVAGLAFAGAMGAIRRGEAAGAAVAGSILSFLLSGLFDAMLEVPRLTTLFLLVCSLGLLMRVAPPRRLPQQGKSDQAHD